MKRALFIGNSYTQTNNLPQMIANAAASTGDTLQFDSNTPGGYTLQNHSSNTTSLSKIAAGNWDYVVLQEQSQLPSFTNADVTNYVFPYARFLDSLIHNKNTCGETVFYMTWGRQNGDASNCAAWPPVCTYAGMDSLIHLRYRIMADRNKAALSPVGAVWKYLRQQAPLINLYSPDGSHPSVAGTYAAACCFYTVFFRKDPTAITFNTTLTPTDAATIRNAAKLIVYDSLLQWNVGKYDPSAGFSYVAIADRQISYTNTSANATTYRWDFGDGNSSAESNPSHTYSSAGSYTVKLWADKCKREDSSIQTITVGNAVDTTQQNDEHYLGAYPNPCRDNLYVKAGSTMAGAAYVLYDNTGRIILTGKLNAPVTTIKMNNLPAGIYLLKAAAGVKKTIKVIKL